MKKSITAILSALLVSLLLGSCGGGNSSKNVQALNTKTGSKNQIKKEAPELFNMVDVKGGWFYMGQDFADYNLDSDERFLCYRKHRTYVSDFYISSSEITQDLYEEIMEENPSAYVGKLKPVIVNKILDFYKFCNKLSLRDNFTPCYTVNGQTDPLLWPETWSSEKELWEILKNVKCDFDADGYRLPTEAEWTYAAKGGQNQEDFIYSGSNNILEVGFAKYENENGEWTYFDSPADVKSKNPNSLGLYDMSGNIREIVWDIYDNYPLTDTVDYRGPDHKNPCRNFLYILKGGSFDDREQNLNIEMRKTIDFDYDIASGFRVCRSKINDDVRKQAEKAREEAEAVRKENINKSIYSKFTEIPAFTYNNSKNESVDFNGLLITKTTLTYDDFLLISDDYCKYLYDYTESYFKALLFNAFHYLNDLSILYGLDPVYTFGHKNEETDEFIPYTEEELKENHFEYYPKNKTNEFYDSVKNVYVMVNTSASGFRLLTKAEIQAINQIYTIDYKKAVFKNEFNKNIRDLKATASIELPAEEDCEYTSEAYENPKSHEISRNLWICRNIPQNEDELKAFRENIAKYSEINRKDKLKQFETILGGSLNSYMKEVKGGTALLSTDTNFTDSSFVEVKLGSYLISEIPFTDLMKLALNQSYLKSKGNIKNQPEEITWYDAAYICNYLSDLYGYDKVYTFNRSTVDIDYTKNGFRMPTEAEWENAARGGTLSKTTKYGFPAEKLIFYGNSNYFDYVKDDWESGYVCSYSDGIDVYKAEANALGIRGMPDLCSEWCNDSQCFNYYDYSNKNNPSYSVSCYDSKPYSIKNMPDGQIYTPERIVKGHDVYTEDAGEMTISYRKTDEPSENNALRLVRTKNPEEMKKLLEDQKKERQEELMQNKAFFEENLKMIPVKAGKFNDRYSDGTKNKNEILNVSKFELSETEITNEMFIRLMHYNPNINNLDSSQDSYSDNPSVPVTYVSQTEAMLFCNELSKLYGYDPFYDFQTASVNNESNGFRLPRDDEWLWAAMECNPDYSYDYSGSQNREEVYVFDRNLPQPVKSKAPNKLGFYDMSGNVFEIVHTIMQDFTYFDSRYAKGGSFYRANSIYYWDTSDKKSDDIGFRIVRNIPETVR